MKIVQVQTQAEAAGAQRVSDMVGEGLRARGHEVRTVFMYRKTGAYDEDSYADFILDHRPRGPLDFGRAVLGLIGYMRRARPDVVISYQHFGNIFGTLAGRLAGARRLVANQSGEPGRYGGRITAMADKLMGVLGIYDYSIINSGWLASCFRNYPEMYRRRMRRIDHGVDRRAERLDRHGARALFGLPDNVYLVVTTGRLTVDKNQVALIEALARLPDTHLAIAGAGPEQAALVTFAKRRGVEDRVHFVGELARARMFDFLAAGDMFAFASRAETFGLSVVEAAIAGLPVVTNRLDVLREVLGEAAVFVDTEQPDQLAAAIMRVKSDPALAVQLAEAGRRLASRYSPMAMAQSYEQLLV